MFSLLPFLITLGTNLLTYFIVQSLGTGLFLVGSIRGDYTGIALIGLGLKLGLLPYYA